MVTLIEKLEAATEGSRELDAEIYKAIELRPLVVQNMRLHDLILEYTISLDDALSLAPEGWTYTIYQRSRDMYGVHLADDTRPNHSASGPTAPLAFCIAALKAREAQP